MSSKPPQPSATAPDPDEDDLDDLDDVLDSFQEKASISNPAPSVSITATGTTAATPRDTAPSASGPGRPLPPKVSHDAASEEDFAAHLQAGMTSFISELDANPDMQAEFEKMMQELVAAGAAGNGGAAGEHLQSAAETAKGMSENSLGSGDSSGKGVASGKKGKTDPLQDTIKKTMERMQASDSTAKQSASTSTANTTEDDMLAAMMKELTEGGEGGEEGFNTMLTNMMAHLTNKDILYDPMKELYEKYPSWLERNRATQSKEDLIRYQEQQKLVREIVERFERKGYSDENEEDREYIVERMQQMQAAGSPPSDLVGDMSAAQEALGDLDQGCPTQ